MPSSSVTTFRLSTPSIDYIICSKYITVDVLPIRPKIKMQRSEQTQDLPRMRPPHGVRVQHLKQKGFQLALQVCEKITVPYRQLFLKGYHLRSLTLLPRERTTVQYLKNEHAETPYVDLPALLHFPYHLQIVTLEFLLTLKTDEIEHLGRSFKAAAHGKKGLL
jgi:hypothetical protein